MSTPSFQDGRTEQYVAEGVLTGDLGVYGVQTPWSEEGVGVAFGVQWRKDVLDFQPDILFQAGDLIGQGGTTPPTFGIIETTDLFVEASIPLVTGMPFAERFAINGGFRHSNLVDIGRQRHLEAHGRLASHPGRPRPRWLATGGSRSERA